MFCSVCVGGELRHRDVSMKVLGPGCKLFPWPCSGDSSPRHRILAGEAFPITVMGSDIGVIMLM